MRYAASERTRTPSGIPTPSPTFSAKFAEEDFCGSAFAADGGDVEMDVGLEFDASEFDTVEDLLRSLVDAALDFGIVAEEVVVEEVVELVVDVTPMVVITVGVPWN